MKLTTCLALACSGIVVWFATESCVAGIAMAHCASVLFSVLMIASPEIHISALSSLAVAQASAGLLAASVLCGSSEPSTAAKVFAWASMAGPAVGGIVLASTLVGLVAFAFQWPVDWIASELSRFFPRRTFRGSHAFITGGGTGLGRSIAQKLAAEGARVTVVSRSEQHLRETCSEIASRGGQCQWFVCDVTDPAALSRAVAEATAGFAGGAPDIVVTCAGLAHPSMMLDTPAGTYRSEMELNYFGTLNVIRECVPSLVHRGRGTLVIVSSALSMMGCPGYTQYAATKWAVRGLAECLRFELSPAGVATHLFMPSNMDTPSFVEENRTKPPETGMIESVTDTMPADLAAEYCIEGVRRGDYLITNTRDLHYVRMSANGPAPSPTPVLDFLLTPLWFVAIGIQRLVWDHRLAKMHRERPSAKPQTE